MELETRYVTARLRAVEERLLSAAEEVGREAAAGAETRAGEYWAGYSRAMYEARGEVRRLREALASLGGLG